MFKITTKDNKIILGKDIAELNLILTKLGNNLKKVVEVLPKRHSLRHKFYVRCTANEMSYLKRRSQALDVNISEYLRILFKGDYYDNIVVKGSDYVGRSKYDFKNGTETPTEPLEEVPGSDKK